MPPTYDGRCGSCVFFGGILCPKDQRGRGAPCPGERRCDEYVPTTAQMRRDFLREDKVWPDTGEATDE